MEAAAALSSKIKKKRAEKMRYNNVNRYVWIFVFIAAPINLRKSPACVWLGMLVLLVVL